MTFRNDGILPTTTICLSGLPHYTEWCGHNYSADDCYTEQCATSTGVESSAEKTKLMTYNTSGINTEIKVDGQKLETVTSFKYLGTVITDEGSKPEILSRVTQTAAALTSLKPVLNDRSISFSSKIRLMHSLVISICLYACESWILIAELQRKYKPWK